MIDGDKIEEVRPEHAAALQLVDDVDAMPLEDGRGVLGERIGDALRLRGEQVLRIGVLRRGEDRFRPVVLLHLAVLHHIDVLREGPHDRQVVGDQDHRHAVARLEVLDELQDLRLHGDVERRRRLVGDQEVRAVGERHGDHHALALAAGKLMRILPEPRRRLGDLHLLQQGAGPLGRCLAAHLVVQMEDLADLLADRVDRVQRRHRLLEDHRDAVAAQRPLLLLAVVDDVVTVEGDARALRHRRAVPQQAHDRARRHRLAAAGFADQRDRLALVELEGDVTHRLELPALDLEADADIAGIEDQLATVLAEVVALGWGEGVLRCVAHRTGPQ
jgi:hypothetical protein